MVQLKSSREGLQKNRIGGGRMKKRLYLKKWLEKTLILINSLIFIFFAMVNDFDCRGFIILTILLIIFSFNALIISKYGRLLKDGGEE